MGLRHIRLALVVLLLLPCLSAWAEENGSSGDSARGRAEQPTLTKDTDLNAIRLAIASGVIDFVNNARKVTLDLEWDLLPMDGTLLESAREQGVRPHTIRLENRALMDGSWINRMKREDRELLSAAFRFDLANPPAQREAEFIRYWQQPGGAGFQQVIGPSGPATATITGRDYFSLLRDFLFISGLLQTKGIRYSVAIEGATPRGENPLISPQNGSNIHWELKVYEFAAADGVKYYRYSAKARMDPIPLLFPNTDQAEARINVGISFIRSGGTAGLLQTRFDSVPGSITVELAPAVKDKLDAIERSHSDSDLESLLKFVGNGAQLGEIVTNGLLGGTSNASIMGGGLIGQGKVSQVVGVNQEFSHTLNSGAGVFFGIEPGGDNSLFLGPSFRWSIFTFAVGLNTYEKERADSSDRLTITRFAGVLSIDLSRITGSKKAVTRVLLDNSVVGGDIGKASEEVARPLTLLYYTLEAPGAQDAVTLVQVKDGAGKPIEEEAQKARITLTPTGPDAPRLLFVPRGRYRIETLPPNTRLQNGNFPIGADEEIVLDFEYVITPRYRLVAAP